MTKTPSRAIVGIAMLASLAWSPPARGQDAEQQLGTVHFVDVVQSAGPAAVRSRDALSTFLLVSRVPGGVRASAPGRSAVRHGLLGNRAQPAPEPARPDAEGQPGLGLAALQKAHGPARADPRERDYIAALLAFYTDHDTVAHGARVQRYLEAMAALAAALSR